MANGESEVEIGYLEKCESYKLESRFFPSKIGGKPAWLDLEQFRLDLSCGVCKKVCIFLCQLYAPLIEQEACHRTIYVFVCRNPECCLSNKADNFKVFSCQLPRKNKYYVDEEPNDLPDWHPESSVERFSPVCFVCGCFGVHQCEKCKSVWYCSEDHRTLDSGHGAVCGSGKKENDVSNILFPEYEILTEAEMIDHVASSKPNGQSEKSDEKKLKEFEKLVEEGKAGTLHQLGGRNLKMLEKLAFGKEDKFLKNYKEKLRLCPDQMIRYDKGGKPLWVAEPGKIEIPKCNVCKSPRQFEFQILSTLLLFLNVDSLGKSIDWGTLVIYTCKSNCNQGPAYKQEFLIKQDF